MLKKIIKGIYNRFNRYKNYYKYKDILVRNKKLKNTKTGKRCFIIGNGPSIEKQNLLKLTNEETFVVNTFYYNPQYNDIGPKNYVAIDSSAPFFRDELIQREKSLTALPTNFFFNSDYYNLFKQLNIYSGNRVHYFHLGGFFKENMAFNIDIDKTIPQAKNVILVCIMTAVYMGFKEIYLLGCEHDFLAHTNQFEEEHAFGTYFIEPKNEEERKHYNMSVKSYEEQIDQVKILFKNYRLLKIKLAKTHPEIKIYNATPNSFLDVFPFIKFEDIKF